MGCHPTRWCSRRAGPRAITTQSSAVDLFVEQKRGEIGSYVPHVVSTAVEHPAILQYLAAKAEANVLTYDLVPVDEEGLVDPKAVAAKVTSNTCLVTVMHANNETGAIQPSPSARGWRGRRIATC